MTEPASARSAQAAPAEVTPRAREALQRAGTHDPRLGPDAVVAAVRTVIAAWASAADGDGQRLAAIASQQVARWLISPAMERWSVGPGPLITQIELSGFAQAGAEPRLQVRFDFDGRPRFADDDEIRPPAETSFVALLELAFSGDGQYPWRVRSGQVRTLDNFLGYTFTSRRERPGEYRERAGSLAPDGAIGPTGRYRIIARFAEHDERFAAWAELEVVAEPAPTRGEAEQLIWPVVDAETTRALGPGDWRPSLLYLDLIELVGEDRDPDAGPPPPPPLPPPASPAAGGGRGPAGDRNPPAGGPRRQAG